MAKRREIRNSTAGFLIFQIEGKGQGVEVCYKRMWSASRRCRKSDSEAKTEICSREGAFKETFNDFLLGYDWGTSPVSVTSHVQGESTSRQC